MEQGQTWREEMVINLQGGVADEHELDASVLGESLLGLVKLAEKTNAVINRDAKVSVKVKGGFNQGSFDYTVALDFFGGIMPAVPQVVEIIKQAIELRSFLGGEKPVKTEAEGRNYSRVENNSGNTLVVQNSAIYINSSPPVEKAFQKFFKPFENGISTFALGAPGVEGVTVESNQKDLFLESKRATVDTEDSLKILEVLTAQMDGKPKGWRFYDVDDSAEFSAGIADFGFLEAVNAGVYGFLRGKHVSAVVRTEKKRIDGRNKTERTIIQITPLEEGA